MHSGMPVCAAYALLIALKLAAAAGARLSPWAPQIGHSPLVGIIPLGYSVVLLVHGLPIAVVSTEAEASASRNRCAAALAAGVRAPTRMLATGPAFSTSATCSLRSSPTRARWASTTLSRAA